MRPRLKNAIQVISKQSEQDIGGYRHNNKTGKTRGFAGHP